MSRKIINYLIVIALVALGVFAGFFWGRFLSSTSSYSAKNTKEDSKETQDLIDSKNEKIESLTSSVSSLKSTKADLESKVSSLESELSASKQKTKKWKEKAKASSSADSIDNTSYSDFINFFFPKKGEYRMLDETFEFYSDTSFASSVTVKSEDLIFTTDFALQNEDHRFMMMTTNGPVFSMDRPWFTKK